MQLIPRSCLRVSVEDIYRIFGGQQLGLLAGLIVFLMLMAGCGGDNADEDSVFLELLGTIPDTSGELTLFPGQVVLINDYARAREVFDIQVPGPNADRDELVQYLGAFTRDTSPRMVTEPFVSGFSDRGLTQLDRPRYLDFDIRQVDQTVEAGLIGPFLEVVRGRFNPAATDRAIKACPKQLQEMPVTEVKTVVERLGSTGRREKITLSQARQIKENVSVGDQIEVIIFQECLAPDLRERQGVSFYSWGPEEYGNLNDRLFPPAFDGEGRGGRIAVFDNYVFRTVETPGMNALIDAYQGSRRSLADVEEFRLLAQGMSTLEAYSILLSDVTKDVGEGSVIEVWLSGNETPLERVRMVELRETFPILRPYQVIGTGAGRDEAGEYMAVVLVHADESSAAENAELLRRRFLEAPPLPSWDQEPFNGIVTSVEAQTDGRVLLAKVRGEDLGARWILWFYQEYPLLPHQ